MSTEEMPATKAHILAIAEGLFASRGYDGVSMREIAEACQITKPNIYYYFKDKESLYVQILEADMLVLIQTLEEAGRQGVTCYEQITAMAQAFWSLMRQKTSLIQITFRQFGGLEHEIRGLVSRYREQLVAPVKQVIEGGIHRGELRALNSHLAALSFVGMVSVFLTEYLLEMPVQIRFEEAVEHAIQLFFDGARAPATAV